MAKRRCGWDAAWDAAKIEHRDIYERLMSTPNPKVVALANADASEQVRRAAEVEFIALVHDRMRATGQSYPAAWNDMATVHADLYRKAVGDTKSTAAAAAAAAGIVPPSSEAQRALR